MLEEISGKVNIYNIELLNAISTEFLWKSDKQINDHKEQIDLINSKKGL